MNYNINPLTPLPIDNAGNPVPVFDPDTGQTQAVVCTNADTVYASKPFSNYARELPYAILMSTGVTPIPLLKFIYKGTIPIFGVGFTLRFEYSADLEVLGENKLEYDGTNFTLLTWFDSGDYAIKEVIGNIRNTLAEYFDVVTLAPLDTQLTYLETPMLFTPINRGATPVIVRVLMSEDGFVGNFPESAFNQASMPVTAGLPVEIIVQPGHVLTAKSSEAGAICYMTPSKKY